MPECNLAPCFKMTIFLKYSLIQFFDLTSEMLLGPLKFLFFTQTLNKVSFALANCDEYSLKYVMQHH